MAQKTTTLGPNFSALLTATFVTNIGDGIRLAALPLLATTLTSSPLLIGGITAAQFLPWTTFALFGGIIVDRSDRRRLILTTQAWRAAVMGGLAVAVLTDVAQIWHLFVVAFVITVGEILVDPSVVAMVPTIVEPDDLDRANGRISTVEIVTNDFAGGPVGTASFAIAPWLPFVIDAVSYLTSTVPFSRLPPSRATSTATTAVDDATETDEDTIASSASSVWKELGEGLRWIRDHPFLRPLTMAIAVFHLGTAGAFSLLILLVIDVLDAPEIVFGIVLTAAAAGATGSSLIAARVTERFSRRAVVTTASAVSAGSVLAAAAVTAPWQLIALWTINGAAGGMQLAIGRGFVQRHTPNDRLGRTAIASRTITRTSFVIGALVAGGIAASSSVRWSYVAAGSFHLLGAILLWGSFRHEPDEVLGT